MVGAVASTDCEVVPIIIPDMTMSWSAEKYPDNDYHWGLIPPNVGKMPIEGNICMDLHSNVKRAEEKNQIERKTQLSILMQIY